MLDEKLKYTLKDFEDANETQGRYSQMKRTELINTLVDVYGYARSEVSALSRDRLEYEYEICVDSIPWKLAFEDYL